MTKTLLHLLAGYQALVVEQREIIRELSAALPHEIEDDSPEP